MSGLLIKLNELPAQRSRTSLPSMQGDDSSQVFAGTQKRVTNSRKHCFAYQPKSTYGSTRNTDDT